MSGPHSARRVHLRRAGALGLGTMLALVVAEFGYRSLRGESLGPTTNPRYVRADSRLGWRYRPNSNERHRTSEFDVAVTIGPHGFRGSAWVLETPKSRPRVLVLGDSFAFGWGVGDDETLAARLAALRPAWNVLNAAVSGYGTDQEFLLLDELAPAVDPDVVVVVYCDNDRFENALDVVYGKKKPRFLNVNGGLELTGVPIEESWLERTSQLWRALEKASWERQFARLQRDSNAEWRLLGDLYGALKARLGTTPLVVTSNEAQVAERVSSIPGAVHVDVPALLSNTRGAMRYPSDGHWTKLGHIEVAKALAPAIDRLLER